MTVSPSLIPTLLPEGEGPCIPLPAGEGLRVKEITWHDEFAMNYENINK
jgi:hypothetical protein